MKILIAVVVVTLFIYLPTASFAQANPHPIFLPLTENQVRITFAAYETKGRRGDAVQFGLEKPIEFPVQGVRGIEVLKLNVGVMPPISQVKKLGYEFGKLGRARTPEEKEAFLKRLVERLKNAPQVIPFYATVQSRSDWSTSLDVTFQLVNEQAITILPHLQQGFDCPPRDIICQVAMAETGVPINFPLYIDSRETPPRRVPFVTDQMKKLKLIVTMGDAKEELVFVLSSIN